VSGSTVTAFLPLSRALSETLREAKVDELPFLQIWRGKFFSVSNGHSQLILCVLISVYFPPIMVLLRRHLNEALLGTLPFIIGQSRLKLSPRCLSVGPLLSLDFPPNKMVPVVVPDRPLCLPSPSRRRRSGGTALLFA